MNYPYKDLEQLTLPSLFQYSTNKYKQHESFGLVGGSAFTYEEFHTKVEHLVLILQQHNIKQGDKVVLLSENTPNWAIAYFAITFFGGVVVPILPDFHPHDIHNIIDHSEAKAVIVSAKHTSTIKKYKNHLDFVVSLENLALIEKFTKVSSNEQKEILNIAVKEEDLACILYTSGTTGHSKGVMLSHKNLLSNATSAYNHIEFKDDDVWLSILPLAHTFECTVGMLIPVLHGASIFYIDKTPTPSVLLKAFQIVKPTMMLSVPLVIEKIYKNKILPTFTSTWIMSKLYSIPFTRKKLNKIAGKKLIESFGGKIRFVGLGGAATAPFVEEFLIEANFPFIVGYGLTETAPLLSGSTLGERTRFKSSGTAVAHTTLAIHNKDPKTGKGEIIAKSPSIMMGYYKDEEQTAQVIKDGWFFTGDLGYLDDDGYLYISGRSKNVIIGPSGENIYPEQIESIINQNKYVVDSLVMELDGKLVAKIHLEYENLDEYKQLHLESFLEEMRKDVNAKVSNFSKMVKFIEEKEPFVKTPTKKIKRYLYTQNSK